jgi:hypothetical protein
MSMRSPTNNWINDSLHKIASNTNKKSLSSERKPVQGSSIANSAHTPNTNSVSDFNKIFKPQIKGSGVGSNTKAPRHQKHSSSASGPGTSSLSNGGSGLLAFNHQNSLGSNHHNESNQYLNLRSEQDYLSPHPHHLQQQSTQQVKGIGKMQPFSEFKLNEHVIRNKLQANNNNNRNTHV